MLMKTVKRTLLSITVALLLFALFVSFVPVSAMAEVSLEDTIYRPSHKGYTLQTKIVNGVMGVEYSGYYFGGDIIVDVEIFSSPSFTIDFYINSDQTEYTDSQWAQRNKIIVIAEEMHRFIKRADEVANTQYDGTADDGIISDVYRYNNAKYGTKLQIDKMTYDMLLVAKEMYFETKGAFNPAVYRLVDLWGFSSRIFSKGNFSEDYDRPVTSEEFWSNGYPLPDDKYVQAFKDPNFIDFSNDAVTLSQEGDEYYITKNVQPATVDGKDYEQWIDLGGIAKGYVADGLKAILSEQNIDRYSVDAGSSSIVFGQNYDGGQNLMTIPDPLDPKSILGLGQMVAVNFGEASVSTSGQYIRKYTTKGIEYSHIVDGFTGAPAQTGVKLVTIIVPGDSDWAGKGDCLTTALTVMGRDKIVDFMNGYLKNNGIQIFVVYQTIEGERQILSNMDKSALRKLSDNYDDYAWAITVDENGNFAYDDSARPKMDLTWLVITLGVLVGVVVVAVIVYSFVKGKRNARQNIVEAKKEKPFKIGDIGVYVAVVLLIVVLFAVFFGGDKQEKIAVIKVVDMETQQTLFVYNVSRGEYVPNAQNGWSIEVEKENDDLIVTLTKTIDGEERCNVVKISRNKVTTVKMEYAVCGFHRDCVNNFPEVTSPDGTIVCSPNLLKVVTE
ncbi:MAG: FAD:protein FMN transferase [Clostridia bacterium]|nr:FAD:protein FMN transferase [Clostridia bacterium]